MNIANLLMHRHMRIPEFMQTELQDFVSMSVQIIHRYTQVINHLDELVEVGFHGREVRHVKAMISEIAAERARIKCYQVELARILFHNESELDPVSLVFWHQILEWLGSISEHTEEAGSLALLLIAQ